MRWTIAVTLSGPAILGVMSVAGSSTTYGPLELTVEVDTKACATGLIECTETDHTAEPAGPDNHNPVLFVAQVMQGGEPVTGLRFRDFVIRTGIGPPGSGQPRKLRCEGCFGGVSGGVYAFFVHPEEIWTSGTYMVQVVVHVGERTLRARWHRSGSRSRRARSPAAACRLYNPRVGFLSDIVGDVRRGLERAPLDESTLMARAVALPEPRGFADALRSGTPAVIAEVKRASPSAGAIADRDASAQARAYEAGGAAAISVLTEPRHFGGALTDLEAVRTAVPLPILRKDFLVHPSQLIESRALGADAVLLIAAAVSGDELAALLAAAGDLGLGALVETHSEADLAKALGAGAEVVGVNARDLETLEVDGERALALLGHVPADRIAVLESGIATRDQVVRAVEAGASAILVGESLMRAADPGAKLRELLGKGTG